jgi:3-isopropylmalate/(R)-2-methylmalate dehydratase small subunit
MEKFIRVTGTAVPLLRPNIDTDVVIRINRLIRHSRGQLGPFAFEAWRYHPDGSENPDFPLNQPKYRSA